MSEEEYNNRIGKINAEISTDRVGADREHYLLLQKLYLKDRYIEGLQQKVEQLENIRKEAIEELSYMSTDAYVEDYDIREKHYNLLMNILSKGDNNGK